MFCLHCKKDMLKDLPKPFKKKHMKVVKELKNDSIFKSNFKLYEKSFN